MILVTKRFAVARGILLDDRSSELTLPCGRYLESWLPVMTDPEVDSYLKYL